MGVFFPGIGLLAGLEPTCAGGTPTTGLHGTLQLAAARGEEITFLLCGRSVNGLWASSTGLDLALGNSSGFRSSLHIVDAKVKDWGDTLTSTQGSSDLLEVPVTFRVPDMPGADSQTAAGAITGDLQYPAPAGGSGFTDASVQLNIPVTLDVVSVQGSASLQLPKVTRGQLRLLLGIPSIAIGFTYWMFFVLWRNQELKRYRWGPRILAGSGFASWALTLVILATGIFGD